MSDQSKEDIEQILEDLNPAPLRVYETIAEIQPCTVDELSKEMSVTPQHYQYLQLFQAGVVDRERRESLGQGDDPFEYSVIGKDVEIDSDKHLLESQIHVSDNPWRMRCPEGHASLTLYSDTYECGACDKTYLGEPYDAKETEFPVDEEPRAKLTHDDVLEALVKECAPPERDACRARYIDVGTPHQVGRILAVLERKGLVERFGSGAKNGHWWKPTEAGIEQARETNRKIVIDERAGTRGSRAEMTPVKQGLLTLAIGLWLLVLLVIVHGVAL